MERRTIMRNLESVYQDQILANRTSFSGKPRLVTTYAVLPTREFFLNIQVNLQKVIYTLTFITISFYLNGNSS